MRLLAKNQLEEMVGGDTTAGGNDRNVTNNSEIETGPVDKPFNDNSEYEKGTPITTDRVTMNYRQKLPWYQNHFGGTARQRIPEGKSRIIKKQAVEEKIDDLVKKSKNGDVTDKNYNPTISKLIDLINDNNFTETQLSELEKAICDKKEDVNKPKNI